MRSSTPTSALDQPDSGRIRRGPAIGGSDVGRCLTRLHHDRFTPAVETHDEVRDRVLARGIDFEDAIIDSLKGLHLDHVDVRALRSDEAKRVTLEAIEAGAAMIIAARLWDGDDLVGVPDLLWHTDAGYVPIDVKHHKVIGDSGPDALRTELARLDPGAGDPVKFRGFRRRDLLQVAHYVELLRRMGYAGPSLGGIVGTDDPLGCTWVDLDAGETSILTEYRGSIAQALEAVSFGIEHPGSPLVAPWMRSECHTCDWAPSCMAILEEADDPTLLRGIDADARIDLLDRGISTIAEVAALPLDDGDVDPGTVAAARARTAHSLLRSHTRTGSIPLPSSSTEIDLDLETHRGNIYLAGALKTGPSGSRFDPIVDWTGTPDGEARLVATLFGRMAEWAETGSLVFHWTDYEARTLSEAAARHGLSIGGADSVEDWFDRYAVDLCAFSREYLVSPEGYSLKVVAPLSGFEWRDEDPGGLQSEIWFERLQEGESAMRRRLLEYNEDDVRAQLAVRTWVRSADSGAGPGSGIRSVDDWR